MSFYIPKRFKTSQEHQIQQKYVYLNSLLLFIFPIYSYFEKGCRKQMCTRQSRKVIWDMINTLFLTLQLSNLLLLLFFSTRKHTSMTSRTILSNFFEEQWTQNRPTVPFGIVACTFSDNLSRNCRKLYKTPRYAILADALLFNMHSHIEFETPVMRVCLRLVRGRGGN